MSVYTLGMIFLLVLVVFHEIGVASKRYRQSRHPRAHVVKRVRGV